MWHRVVSAVSLFIILPAGVRAQLSSQLVGSGFSAPVFGVAAPGQPNNMYVVEQTGDIRVMNINTGAHSLFFDVNGNVPSFANGGERGLLGLAFEPNFNTTNGRFYVNYTQANGALTVDRFTMSGGVPGNRQNIIQIAHSANANHNGGWTAFGPDGFLYVATGDGGSGNDPPNNAQNINSLLGKMLRLDVSGAGPGYVNPPSNPFFGATAGADEIWAYGLRNHWRNSFDAAGNLYIADVGQNTAEEINFQAAGAAGGQNYGWRPREGKGDNPGVADPPPSPRVDPFYDYPHDASNPLGGFAIVGGYVYRGNNILDGGQNLDGTYFFADNVLGRIWSLRYSGTGELFGSDITLRTAQLDPPGTLAINSPSSFAEDSLGRQYILDLDGEIYRITGAAIPEPSTWMLIGLTLAGAGVVTYRRRRNLDTQAEA
jgi:glucose/arabinose dehydrogenase